MDELRMQHWHDPEEPRKRGVKLAGRLTIAEAAELKAALVEGLNGALELQVDLSEVEEVDFSILQLLCAAHRSAEQGGKSFMLKDCDNSTYHEAVNKAGMTRESGCPYDKSGSCLWVFTDNSGNETVAVETRVQI